MLKKDRGTDTKGMNNVGYASQLQRFAPLGCSCISNVIRGTNLCWCFRLLQSKPRRRKQSAADPSLRAAGENTYEAQAPTFTAASL